MEFGELLREWQAQSGAAMAARQGALHLLEGSQHALDMVVRNADARVATCIRMPSLSLA